jgi:hypothetical protein
MRRGLVIWFLGMSCWVQGQQTNVLTFEYLTPPDAATSLAMPRTDQGMLISGHPYSSHYLFGTNASAYAGSIGLHSSGTNTTTILVRTNGAAFDVLGISLAGISGEETLATFIGYRGFNPVVTQVCPVARFTNGHRFLPHEFANFTNITELRWRSPIRHQFDDIRVRLDPMARPPVPMVRLATLPRTNYLGQIYHLGIIGASGLQPGSSYQVESSTDLIRWQEVATIGYAYGSFNPALHGLGLGETGRYYRVRLE